jgi:transposase
VDGGKAAWPSLRAFTTERCQVWSDLHGMRHEVVTQKPSQKGFAVLPRRLVVERSFGWLTHWGSLLRDRAGRLDVAAARIDCAVVLVATEALINPA